VVLKCPEALDIICSAKSATLHATSSRSTDLIIVSALIVYKSFAKNHKTILQHSTYCAMK